MRSTTHLALLAFAVLIACNQPPDLSAELDVYAEHVNDARAGVCMCAVDAGFPTEVECGEALGIVGFAEIDCMSAVLDDYDGAADYLACVSSAYSDGASCLEANTTCEDGQVPACEQARETAMAGCTQIAEGGRAAFEACIAGS